MVRWKVSIPGMNYVDVAKKNNPQMLQSRFFQQQQQQQQRANHNQQNQLDPRRTNQQGRRRASALVFGNVKDGKEETGNCLLTADENLVASGVSKDATTEQLKEFIVSKGIELLTNHKEEARSFSYRIAIKPSDYDKALHPDVWPYRVGVRLYKPKRWQPKQNSWNQQSSQTGGNINDQRRNNGTQQEKRPGPQQTGAQALNNGDIDTQNRYVVPGFAPEVFN